MKNPIDSFAASILVPRAPRRFRRLALPAALAAAVLGYGPPATATIMTATFTGTVAAYDPAYPSYQPPDDVANLFDCGGCDLAGKAFTATYTYDTSLGLSYNAPGEAVLYGGSSYGAQTPITEASITINGVTVSEAGTSNYLDIVEVPTGDGPGFEIVVNGASNDFSLLAMVVDASAGIPVSYDTPFVRDEGVETYLGEFVYDDLGRYSVYPASQEVDFFNVETVAVSAEEAPEPASLTLLGAGIASLGMIRRRRGKA